MVVWYFSVIGTYKGRKDFVNSEFIDKYITPSAVIEYYNNLPACLKEQFIHSKYHALPITVELLNELIPLLDPQSKDSLSCKKRCRALAKQLNYDKEFHDLLVYNLLYKNQTSLARVGVGF